MGHPVKDTFVMVSCDMKSNYLSSQVKKLPFAKRILEAAAEVPCAPPKEWSKCLYQVCDYVTVHPITNDLIQGTGQQCPVCPIDLCWCGMARR